MNDAIHFVGASKDTKTSTEQLVHDTVIRWLRTELGTKISHIDVDASLFELGIDSLGAATIGCELEEATKKRLNSEVVYELETIKELAEYLDSVQPQSTVAASPSGPHGTDALTAKIEPQSPVSQSPVSQSPVSQSPVSQSPVSQPTDSSTPSDPIQHYERLNRRVRALKQQGLYFFEPEISEHDGAWVVTEDRRMLMFSSYEYLGLLGHSHLRETAVAALHRYGTGHHGARLLVGTTTVHKQLEAKLARFVDAQDAMVFSSGYVANLATISALVGPGDYVIGDELNHASIKDGCRMSGADVQEFKHNDPDALAERLQQADGRRSMVIVDSIFSMDGDIINLPEVVFLCKQFRALLMVDEAHSIGVLGNTGKGIQEHFDLEADDIDIKMGTLSKTLASSGGYVAGREELITYLRHHARGYIFSGAVPACQASVSIAALEVLEREPERVERLWDNVDRFVSGLNGMGFDTADCETPIVPVMTRSDPITLAMTQICRSLGLLVAPVCFPAVPMDAPRLRTCVSAVHTVDDIDFALDVLQKAGRETNLIP